MQNPAPAPRLPLEPDQRQLYRPPPRLGCSGVALVSVVTLLAFALLFIVFTPRLVDGLRGFSLTRALGLERPTPPAGTAVATVTAVPTPVVAVVPPTLLPDQDTPVPLPPTARLPTSTPEPVYVAIGNSAGDNVALRQEPRTDAKKLIALPPRAVLRVVGDDVTTDGKVWRNVGTTGDSALTGWVMAQYLVPADPP